MSKARGAFELLTKAFPDYADGQNYLGLIALDQRRLEDAQRHFEATVELGRRLLARRVAKRSWWRDHDTRPYIRGLNNLVLTLVQRGRYDEALALCDRLESECQESEAAHAHRAAIYLNLGNWQKARRSAINIHQSSPAESLLAAFATFELGNAAEARVFFLHAVLNVPRTVAMILGAKLKGPPTSSAEISDHNGGIVLQASISEYARRQRRSAKRFFLMSWQDEAVGALRAQLDDAAGRWKAKRDSRSFDIMTRMQSFDYALGEFGTAELTSRVPRVRHVH